MPSDFRKNQVLIRPLKWKSQTAGLFIARIKNHPGERGATELLPYCSHRTVPCFCRPPLRCFYGFLAFLSALFRGPLEFQSKLHFPAFHSPPFALRERKQGQAGCKKPFSQQKQHFAIKLKRPGCAACSSLPCFRTHLQRDSSPEWVT